MSTQCRTCTSSKTVSFIYDELLQIKELSTIANLLIYIIPQLTIRENDDLPKHVCQNCLNKLLEIYEFQQMCLNTERKWLELLSKTSTRTIPKTTIEIEETDEHNLKDPLDDDRMLDNVDNIHQEIKVESLEITGCQSDSGNNMLNRLEKIKKNSLGDTLNKTFKTELSDILINSHKQELFIKKATNHEITHYGKGKNVRISNNRNANHNQRKNKMRIEKFTCHICGKALSASGVLNRHIKQVHRITKCKDDNSTSQLMDDDHKTRIKNLPNDSTSQLIHDYHQTRIKMIDCNEKIAVEQELNNDKPNSNSNSNNDIEQAQRTNIKLKFMCTICGKNLSSSSVLNRHTKQVHGIVKEKNSQEEKVSGNNSENAQNGLGLKKRIKRSHFCKFCNKGFSIPTRLRDHERVHTGERPHLCSQCGLGFKTASNLIQHLYRHKGDKRYECPHCPKRFICLADLGSHKAVHNKERPHSCEICGSSFAKSYLLRRHKMYHSDDRPHKCDYCDMRFVMACQMRSHRRIHTGEKPYKCKYCPRVFARSTHAARHLRSHLGANIHGCELCPQRFRLRSELRAHFVSHKNEDDQTRCKNLEALKCEQENLQIRLNVFSNKAAQ